MGTHSREDGALEQMVHRALGQDDGRGLGEPNNDLSRIEVVVYLLVQPMEPSVRMARRLALALQHQPRLLHTEARGGPKAWIAKYKPYYFPFVSQFPHNIHLLSFKARDSITDDIILRVVHIYETGQHNTYSQPKEIEWDRILQEFTFDSKRERSLAMSLDIPELQKRKDTTLFLPSSDTLNHASGVAPAFVKQDNQNTEEEGVFISQAALDEKKKAEEEQRKNPGARAPLALDTITPEDSTFALAPMQIKSFFVQLVPRDTKFTLPTTRPTPVRSNIDPLPSFSNDDPDASPPVIIEPNGSVMSNAEVSDVELRTFFGISIVGTGLVILAYWRLRQRRNGKPNLAMMKRKGLIEV